MRIAGWILTVAVLGVAACGGADDSDQSAADDESDAQPPTGCSTTDSIPQGASIEVVVDDDRITPGQSVRFHLVAPGDTVRTGMPFTMDRWDGDRWTTVPGLPTMWTLQAFTIGSGDGTQTQSWPTDDAASFKPGWYRVAKSATYEGERDIDLVAHGCFEVRGPSEA